MRTTVTSLQNAEVKRVVSLHKRKGRMEQGLFIVEGVRLAEEALRSGWEITACFFTEQALCHERPENLAQALEKTGKRIYIVTEAIYQKISETKQPQGVLFVLKIRSAKLNGLLSVRNTNRSPLYLVLDRIQDPGNVGTILRAADAAGCTAVFTVKGTADLFAGKTVRATMGALFRVPFAADLDKTEIVAALKERGCLFYATAMDRQARPYFSMNFVKPTAVVFGNEGSGVDAFFLQQCQETVYIPMQSGAESLNVAVAASIILYEAVRQRMMDL